MLILNSPFFFSSLPGQVKRVVHQAFWDVVKADLSAEPPQYEYAIRLFEEIREASWYGPINALTHWGQCDGDRGWTAYKQ